jgi:hypothetical protein
MTGGVCRSRRDAPGFYRAPWRLPASEACRARQSNRQAGVGIHDEQIANLSRTVDAPGMNSCRWLRQLARSCSAVAPNCALPRQDWPAKAPCESAHPCRIMFAVVRPIACGPKEDNVTRLDRRDGHGNRPLGQVPLRTIWRRPCFGQLICRLSSSTDCMPLARQSESHAATGICRRRRPAFSIRPLEARSGSPGHKAHTKI